MELQNVLFKRKVIQAMQYLNKKFLALGIKHNSKHILKLALTE
jgi:hypothetical protein